MTQLRNKKREKNDAGDRKTKPRFPDENRGSEAGVGFEPTNDGFANRCLRPLGYPALFCSPFRVRAHYTQEVETSQAQKEFFTDFLSLQKRNFSFSPDCLPGYSPALAPALTVAVLFGILL